MDETNYSLVHREELADVLSWLSGHDVEYCILHPFPERGFLSKTDLDLYVRPDRSTEFAQFLAARGWFEEPNFRFPRRRKYFSKLTPGLKLKLDISREYGVFGKGTFFLYRGEVKRKIGADGHSYLDDLSGWLFIQQKARQKGCLSEEKIADLNTLANRCSEVKAILQNSRVDASTLDLHFTPVHAGRFNLAAWTMAHARRARPAQGRFTISLVGLDGAGKSTYTSLLRQEFANRNVAAKLVYLGYSQFRLIALRRIASMKTTHSRGPVRKLLMVVYLLLLPFDLLCRRGSGRYDVLLTDRHPMYEPVFSAERPGLYDKLLSRICPSPDLVLYLTGNPEALWSRKKETGLTQYLLQREEFERHLARHSHRVRTVEIDTVGEVQTVLRKLLSVIDSDA